MSEILLLVQVTSDEQKSHIRGLFSEYAQLLHDIAQREYGIPVDIDATLQIFMTGVEAFYPPNGRLYLAKYNSEFVGGGCLNQLTDDVGEIKRMFVNIEAYPGSEGAEAQDVARRSGPILPGGRQEWWMAESKIFNLY